MAAGKGVVGGGGGGGSHNPLRVEPLHHYKPSPKARPRSYLALRPSPFLSLVLVLVHIPIPPTYN